MNWKYFLVSIRWQNVLIIWLMQSVVFFRYLLPYCGNENYSFISFSLFILATGSVLGAGNIYNDIRDIATDSLHPQKPRLIGTEIPLSQAWNWYYMLTGLPVAILITGVWLYNWPFRLLIVFTGGIILLLLYSRYLKSTILIGNVLISLLCSVSVWMTTWLLPECNLGEELVSSPRVPVILYGYIANAFVITLLREIVKDKEDAIYDIKAGIMTIGSLQETTFRMVFNAVLFANFLMNGFWFYKLRSVITPENWNLGMLFIFIPLCMIALIFNLPHRPRVYAFLSKLIKIYILFAILLLILWQRP